MATILPFVIPRRGHAPAPEGAATIIIFPGVRYERRPETDKDKSEATRRRPRGKQAAQPS